MKGEIRAAALDAFQNKAKASKYYVPSSSFKGLAWKPRATILIPKVNQKPYNGHRGRLQNEPKANKGRHGQLQSSAEYTKFSEPFSTPSLARNPVKSVHTDFKPLVP